MFTIDQIKEAHSKVKSGADFPQYVQDLIALGVTGYSTYVSDGHTDYNGVDHPLQSGSKYDTLKISGTGDPIQFREYLNMHQRGETDYPGFCRHAAETGVQKWTIDTKAMTCTYYDLAGQVMLVETIPQP